MLNKHTVDDSSQRSPQLSYSEDVHQTMRRHGMQFTPLFFIASLFAPRTDNTDDKKNGD